MKTWSPLNPLDSMNSVRPHIERPFRFGGDAAAKTTSLVLAMVICGIAGSSIYLRNGLPVRRYNMQFDKYAKSMRWLPEEIRCVDIPYAYKKNSDWFCSVGNRTARPSLFAFGDSHAIALLPALKRYASAHNVGIKMSSASGCPPLLGIQTAVNPETMDRQNCEKLNEKIYEYVRDNKVGAVLLIGRWTYYTQGVTRPNELVPLKRDGTEAVSVESSRSTFRHGLTETIQRFKKIGVKVYLVNDDPQQLYDPHVAFRKAQYSGLPLNYFSVSKREHEKDEAWVKGEFQAVSESLDGIINFDDILCPDVTCPLEINGKMLYHDDDHLSVDGAMFIYDRMANVLRESSLPTIATR